MSAIQGNGILQQQFVRPEVNGDGQVHAQPAADAAKEGEAKPLENRTVEMTATDLNLIQPPLDQVEADGAPEVEQKPLGEREVSVAAKPIDLDEILATTLKTVKFNDNVKGLLRRTLEQQSNNKVVTDLVERPSLDTLSLLCKLATKMPISEDAPREEVLAVAYLRGFSASTAGEVALTDSAPKEDAVDSREDKIAPKEDPVVPKEVKLASDEYTAVPDESFELFDECRPRRARRARPTGFCNRLLREDTVVRGDLERKVRAHAGDEKNFEALKRVIDERVNDFAANGFEDDELPAARKVLSLKLLSHLRCSDFYPEDKWEAEVFDALVNGVFDSMQEDEQSDTDLVRRVNLHVAIDAFLREKGAELDALIADRNTPFKSELAALFKEKLDAFLEGRSDDLYLTATTGEESEGDLLERLYEEAMEPCELMTKPMPVRGNCAAVQGRMVKWDAQSPLNFGAMARDFREVMVLQTMNNCFIDAPLNGILASGGIGRIESVLPQNNENGDYVFTLGRPVRDVRPEVGDEYKRSFTVSADDVNRAKNKWLAERNAKSQGAKDVFTDLDWALYIAQGRLKGVQRKTDPSIGENPPLGLFNTDREIMNLLGYAEDVEVDGGTEKPRQRMIDPSLAPGGRLKQVYDVDRWRSEHPDGVLTLNINDNHFVAVMDVYYKDEKDFGFVVRDSNGNGASNVVRTVNVCEDSSYTVEFYVPGEESEA